MSSFDNRGGEINMQQRTSLPRSVGIRVIRIVLRHKWIKISILFLLCLIFYTVSTKYISRNIYEPEELLGPAYSLLKHNGQVGPDDIPELSHLSDNIKQKALFDLRYVIKTLIKSCTSHSINGCESQKKFSSDSAILTLFTTWKFDKDKFYINNNTLYNWRTLQNVRLVVFSNDSSVAAISKQAGWEILPIVQEATGTPVLPAMFRAVMLKYKSEFYGFANGDLLFTDSLTTTLEAILCQLTSELKSQAVLIIGKRTNVPSKVIEDAASSWNRLKSLAQEHGNLFQADAEDYFITNKFFPWSSFLPLVIGRPGYDNWVVTYGRLKNATVIDATDTVLCIHQTMESRGNYEGLYKGEYNVEMVEKQNLPFPVFSWGKTYCADTLSWYDMCSQVTFKFNTNIPQVCKSYHWTHRLLNTFGMANNTIRV